MIGSLFYSAKYTYIIAIVYYYLLLLISWLSPHWGPKVAYTILISSILSCSVKKARLRMYD